MSSSSRQTLNISISTPGRLPSVSCAASRSRNTCRSKPRMTPDTAAHLLALNRQFYDTYSGEFSNTRRGIPPGMQRLLSTLPAEATVLDLGGGNGRVAGLLAENNWHSRYTGLDGSERLLS